VLYDRGAGQDYPRGPCSTNPDHRGRRLNAGEPPARGGGGADTTGQGDPLAWPRRGFRITCVELGAKPWPPCWPREKPGRGSGGRRGAGASFEEVGRPGGRRSGLVYAATGPGTGSTRPRPATCGPGRRCGPGGHLALLGGGSTCFPAERGSVSSARFQDIYDEDRPRHCHPARWQRRAGGNSRDDRDEIDRPAGLFEVIAVRPLRLGAGCTRPRSTSKLLSTFSGPPGHGGLESAGGLYGEIRRRARAAPGDHSVAAATGGAAACRSRGAFLA